MIIGVPKEMKREEYRVALTPAGTAELVTAGNEVLVETGAGDGSGFGDDCYLKSGLRVIVTSTAAADGHTHTWEIQGGNVLYESICYNCHSNDKRGAAGMPGTNYTPLQSQRDALANPSAAPLSTAPAPNPTSTPTPSGTGAPDGAALYASNCAGCHGPLATSTKRGRSVSQIKSAIASPSTGMGYLGTLTDAQIQAIATALQ